MRNIVLTGFMGSGKSTVGRLLADRLGMRLFDTDAEVERVAGMSIPEIFERYGEERFRELEHRVVRAASELKGCVIVTGGGVVLNPENVALLRRSGVIFYLHAEPEEICRRLSGDTGRPLLRGGRLEERVRELMRQRAERYADHDFMVDTTRMSPEQVAERVAELYLQAENLLRWGTEGQREEEGDRDGADRDT